MRQAGVVYMKKRLQGMTIPVIFYGEDDKDVVVAVTISAEEHLSWLETLLTGYRYRYTIVIS